MLHLLQSFDLLPGRSGFRAVLQVLQVPLGCLAIMYNVVQVHRRMSCNNAWVWPIDGGQEALKGGRWAVGRMGDGRWALGDAASSCRSATTSGKRGKLGGGNQRCSHFKDDTSSFLLLLLTFPPSNKKDGRLQEYFQLLGEASSWEDHQTQNTFNQCVYKSYGCPLEGYVHSTGHS